VANHLGPDDPGVAGDWMGQERDLRVGALAVGACRQPWCVVGGSERRSSAGGRRRRWRCSRRDCREDGCRGGNVLTRTIRSRREASVGYGLIPSQEVGPFTPWTDARATVTRSARAPLRPLVRRARKPPELVEQQARSTELESSPIGLLGGSSETASELASRPGSGDPGPRRGAMRRASDGRASTRSR
jgi:hypothetical protein